jgi:GT2 family glycosyltransferase/nucleoside-diphosphate-sugar epimerase
MQNKASNNFELAAVSIVILNYNAGDLLVVSVSAALAQARQVVVIDNASTDPSLALLESGCADETRLKIVRNKANLGFAAGCNVGIRQCNEPYILFLNPDCVLGPNTLRRMLQTLDEKPDTGMVGGLLLSPDGTEQGGGRRAVPTPWRSFVRAFGLTGLARRWPRLFDDFHLHEQPLPDKPIPVEAISGALMLVRREALEEIGLWDEEYFLHCEDLDLCMRFRKQGWNILFDPGAPAVHVHGACSKSRPVFVEWHKHKGMVRFYRKFFQHQYPGLLMWLVIIGVWLRFGMVATLKTLKKKEEQESYPKHVFDQQAPGIPSCKKNSNDANSRKELSTVAVVGATSMVGHALLPMLTQSGIKVIAFTRKPVASREHDQDGIVWKEMSSLSDWRNTENISDWVWVAPIKALPEQLEHIQRAGAKHVVVLSTTSRFTKKASSSVAERELVGQITVAEERLQEWGGESAVTWTILRPTLIYGLGMDKNVGVIASFIRRFHFFPVLGKASGMRQPIHARDVAAACKAALESSNAANHAYNISGAEKMTYRAMVTRIFEALSIRPRILSMPLWMFAAAVAVVRVLPPYRSWSPAMVERMNLDMAFDNNDAARDLGFVPQAFKLDASDLLPADSGK